jgi:hypothetical protein
MGLLAAMAPTGMWLAQQQDDPQLFLGKDFLPWMVLAFGAAMVIGPLLALVRPPRDVEGGDGDGTPERPPLARTIAMIAIGAVAAVWGAASLLS